MPPHMNLWLFVCPSEPVAKDPEIAETAAVAAIVPCNDSVNTDRRC
jgi:hypothetical protein